MDVLGPIGVVVAWAAAAFVALQLVTGGKRRAAWAVSAVAVAGILALGWRTGSFGYGWLRSELLESDAVALGALVPVVAAMSGLAAGRAVRTTWGLATGLAASLALLVASLTALAVGHSGWYWEFAGIIVAGAALLALGTVTGVARDIHPDRRVIALGIALFGAFLSVGGGLLLLAWNAAG